MLQVGAMGLLGATLPAGRADAEATCRPIPGGEQCTVGIPSWRAGMTYARQRNSQWCWAACIEMIFMHHGLRVSQERIVHDAWGGLINMPGGAREILGSLNRTWVDERGRRFRSFSDWYPTDPGSATHELARSNPLMLGTHGHAVVLTAMTYRHNPYGQFQVLDAAVRDPWPGRGRRSLSAREWRDINFLARVGVT